METVNEPDLAADPFREQMLTAERLARLMMGEDDERFLLAFQALVNVMDTFRARPGEEAAEHARAILRQSAMRQVAKGRGRVAASSVKPLPPPASPDDESIYSDPIFLANATQMLADRDRIVGGIPTSEYPDCVAAGGKDQWCCTGTLIAPNVVVTAGHCHGACTTRVFVGNDVTEPQAGVEIKVAQSVRHPDFNAETLENDLTVLILAGDANVKPRALAEDGMLEAASSVRLAGFGNSDVWSSGGFGLRRMVDVPLASNDPKYGANVEYEFVAGAPFLDRDSCNGDSGGPAYVKADGEWYLAGATSRATASTVRQCGDGGIYVQIRAFEDWIRSVAGAAM
jgi:secreted trypsin-like serine protease